MPPFGAWKRVKGKRAQIPHDLVTVIREPAARVHLHRSLGFDPGRRRQALSFQPGNLPAAGYGGKRPRSRGIGCTAKHLLKIRGLLCCHSARKRPRFLRGQFPCALLFSPVLSPGFKQGKEAKTHEKDHLQKSCRRRHGRSTVRRPAGRLRQHRRALTALPRAPSPTKAPQKAPQKMQKRPQTREMQTKWPLRTAPI